ncbi:snRNA-activating protein complex subunit 3 [Trichinella sp. T8]|nr:snRNA-activating protein complex subunit 3 [Trichinella sp. T8]
MIYTILYLLSEMMSFGMFLFILVLIFCLIVFAFFTSMDSKQRPDRRWNITDEISIKDFAEKAVGAVEQYGVQHDCDEEVELQEIFGMNEEEIQNLKELCDPKHMSSSLSNAEVALTDGENCAGRMQEVFNLETVQMTMNLNSNPQFLLDKQAVRRVSRFSRINDALLSEMKAVQPANQPLVNNGRTEELILTVAMLSPTAQTPITYSHKYNCLRRFDSSFLILGSQSLCVLRDQITCRNDFAPIKDYSDCPSQELGFFAKDIYKGGFFYINGVFYVDTRHEDATDLSEEIIGWASNRFNDIGPFSRAPMEDTTFLDLKLRLGNPYLYLHQGTCEHLMVFVDVRLAHPSDPQERRCYPIDILKPHPCSLYCAICGRNSVKWLVQSAANTPYPVMHLCETCFISWGYGSVGEKMCEFSAYPFVDHKAFE